MVGGYAGIDTSSKGVHVVLLDEGGNLDFMVKFEGKGKLAADRLPEICRGLASLPDVVGGCKVAIERPLYYKSPTATISISMVIGAVIEVLELAGIEYELVENTSWKKYVLGKGNADKPSIMKYTTEFFGHEFDEQDWADASCIALWSRRDA